MSNLLFKVLKQILVNQTVMLESLTERNSIEDGIVQVCTVNLIKEIYDAVPDLVDENDAALQAEAEQHRECIEEQEIQQSIDEQMQEEADELISELSKSRVDWKAGDTAVIKDHWDKAGQKLQVLGSAVFLKQ